MNYSERKKLIENIEKITKKPLLTYVTTIRQDLNVQMATDVIGEFIKQINLIDEKYREISLLIISNGGDPIVSYRIISLLRERFDKITVIIPYVAYSAATLLALGADEIIMHPYGNLGPIDPQININLSNGQKVISYNDLVKYIEFIKETSESDEILKNAINKLTDEISPSVIGTVKRSYQLGLDLGEKLLSTHMNDKEEIKRISKTLNTNFYNHGFPLGKKDSKNLGLNIINIDKELENLIWTLTEIYLKDLKFNVPFNPDEIVDNIIPNIKFQAKKSHLTIEEKIACVESSNLESYIANIICANLNLLDDGVINKNIIIKSGYWKSN